MHKLVLYIAAVEIGLIAGIMSSMVSIRRKSFVVHLLSHLVTSNYSLSCVLGIQSLAGQCGISILITQMLFFAYTQYDENATIYVIANFMGYLGYFLFHITRQSFRGFLFGYFWLIRWREVLQLGLVALGLSVMHTLWGERYLALSMLSINKRTTVHLFLDILFQGFLAVVSTLLYRYTGISMVNSALVLPGLISTFWAASLKEHVWLCISISTLGLLCSVSIAMSYSLPIGPLFTAVLSIGYFLSMATTYKRTDS